MSTPDSDSGCFYQTWSSEQRWLRIAVPATECTRIKPEYLCEFRSHNRSVFQREMLTRFFSHDTFGHTRPVRFEL